MIKNKIFDNFLKIAQEKDLESDKTFKKLDSNPRASSSRISDIEKLYYQKFNNSENMDYKNNIMEIAHKDSAVIAPSYDKLNGLVENNIERQQIMLNIVNKTNNGLLTQHKYAKKNLILNLVKIANYLDNNDQDNLRAFADKCLEQLSEEKLKNNNFNKKAAIQFLPIVGWSLLGLAGAKSISEHFGDNIPAVIKELHNEFIDAIDTVVDGNFFLKLFRATTKESFNQNLKLIKSEAKEFYKNIVKYNQLEDMYRGINLDDIINKTSKNLPIYQNIDNQVSNIQKNIENSQKILSQLLDTVIDNIENHKSDIVEDWGSWMPNFVRSLHFLGEGERTDDKFKFALYKDHLDILVKVTKKYKEYIENFDKKLKELSENSKKKMQQLRSKKQEEQQIDSEKKPFSNQESLSDSSTNIPLSSPTTSGVSPKPSEKTPHTIAPLFED